MNGAWRFADCVLMPGTRELRRAGRPVELEPRAFDLLAFLLANRDRVVGRDEMQAAVWPGMVVADSAFTQAILKVRRAVGDDGRAQRIVRTISRRGYRFVADVHEDHAHDIAAEAGTVAAPPAAGPRPREVPRPQSRRRWHWPTAAAVGVVLALVMGGHQLSTRQLPRYAVLPVRIESSQPEFGWVELGLMAMIDEALERQAIDTLAPSAVLGSLQQEDVREADGPTRARHLVRSHGRLQVLAATATPEAGGWRLDYEVHGEDGIARPTRVHAATPAALAHEVARALGSGRAPPAVTDTTLADELHARGLAATLQGDVRAAAEYFRVALREEPGRQWTRYELAVAQRQLGEVDAARETLAALVAGAQESGDARLELAARSAQGILQWRAGNLDAAEEQLQRALALAEASPGGTDRADLALNLGIIASSRGKLDDARELYLRALARHRSDGARAGEARVYNSLGVLAWKRGDHGESARMHQAALEIRRELGLRGDLAASLNNLGTVSLARGDWPRAEALLTEALTLRRALGDGGGEARSIANLADLRRWQGRYAEADRHALDALELARRHRYQPAVKQACGLVVDLALRRADADEAERRMDDCALTGSASAADRRTRQLQQLELDALRGGAVDAPGTPALLAGRELDSDDFAEAEAALASARIAAVRRDTASRKAHLQAALAHARRTGHPGLVARAAAELGDLWLHERSPDAVEPLVAEGALWPDYVPGIVLAALHAHVRGDLDAARRHLQRAQSLSAEAWTSRIEAALARIEPSLASAHTP